MVLGLRHETARGDNKEGDIERGKSRVGGKCVPMFDIKSVSGSYTTDGKKKAFITTVFSLCLPIEATFSLQ